MPPRDLLRRRLSPAVLAAAVLLLFVLAPEVPLIVFAGVLFAIFLRGGGGWLGRWLGIGTGLGMLVFWLLVLAAFGTAAAFFAPVILAQTDQLAEQLPPAMEDLRRLLDDTTWGHWLLHRAMPRELAPTGAAGALTSATFSTFGALGTPALILIIGIYGAIDPHPYRRGLVALLAPSLRPWGGRMLDQTVETLRHWLVGRMLSMATVGVLTALGLWMIGVPLAIILGSIAALLTFIPNLGPVLSVAPAILLAVPEGLTTVLLVLAIYAAVQAFESYVVTPLIQRRQVSLPAAFILSTQLLVGILLGLLGLILATPMAAVLVMLTREIYVKGWLDGEPGDAGEA